MTISCCHLLAAVDVCFDADPFFDDDDDDDDNFLEDDPGPFLDVIALFGFFLLWLSVEGIDLDSADLQY